ncbi:uncharacterized protein LAESUDRAFT_747766 [Laetiporus sulphureus 93-53]|uniref:RRM domain-containing protein n=1 Tax=Laetiporus sulphureus 93-53 TaxID=1314785 RepID=A0A165GJD1_9APHY|nr:uncharacterized protein LAESUDRAFT_747766 [Laetiporus sulphureus 93-53]KZT10433.1 hypothetical protein LAESUDRAFT_747766 [Laetiporus sulphureus 93-53]
MSMYTHETQSSSSSLSSTTQHAHQHSPRRSSPLSQTLTTDHDTSTNNPPVSPGSSITSDSGSSRYHCASSDSFVSSNDSSSLQSLSREVSSSDVSHQRCQLSSASEGFNVARPIASMLSASAPQFQSRILDAPIDIHKLAPAVSVPVKVAVHAITPHVTEQAVGTPSLPTSGQGAGALPASQTSASDSRMAPMNTPQSADGCKETSPVKSQPMDAQTQSSEFRTPNVYINGLPPNFPEEDLFKMTHEFGQVLSVRTFTRHVCDKPSGYGFVLFDTIEAAEKCVESLRKYRNLHPSFSKQIHKIPGTIYSSSSFTPGGPNSDIHRLPADSFKARMEQLKDTTSTNLYMEGLPLSIDDQTLAALVRPYRIMSSRFFQTRLSNPPRMIAFVRLETREAAEEVVERLHGRLVRGWEKDSGCRISVRFADTTEQRELRRLERMNRDGDNSPGRITMAQAALLNLNGTQLNPRLTSSPLMRADLGYLQNGVNANSPLLSGRLASNLPLSSVSSTLPLAQQPFLQSLDPMRGMSLLAGGEMCDGLISDASRLMRPGIILPHPSLLQDDSSSLQNAQLQSSMGTGVGGLAARADNGFTPMERMLLQAHVQRQQVWNLLENQMENQYGASLLDQARGVMDSPVSGKSTLGREPTRRLLDVLPPMSEDDFHAQGPLQQQQSLVDLGDANNLLRLGAENRSSFPLGSGSHSALVHQQHQRNRTHASHARVEVEGDNNAQALHMRSTTFPSQYLSNRSSQSLLTTFTSQDRAVNSSTSNNKTNHIHSMSSTIIGSASHYDNRSSSTNYLVNSKHNSLDRTSLRSADPDDSNAPFVREGRQPTAATMFSEQDNTGKHDSRTASIRTNRLPPRPASNDEDHSPLVSPALTHSGRTPVSLSPATPFFNSDRTFEGPAMIAAEGIREVRLDIGEQQKKSVGGH